MAEVKDCPGFETFGEDVRAGREAQGMTRRALAEEVSVSTRYLANIELGLIIPSVPVMLRLIQICHLPMERYFNPRVICLTNDILARTAPQAALCGVGYRVCGFRGRRARFFSAKKVRSAWRMQDSFASSSGL